ncbi:MAG: hypothetical protein EOO61_18580 [Hymenobacter sp.]|nr:MAG: hypothetical protein EOO61_18580 [Hymenobacter sp.]
MCDACAAWGRSQPSATSNNVASSQAPRPPFFPKDKRTRIIYLCCKDSFLPQKSDLAPVALLRQPFSEWVGCSKVHRKSANGILARLIHVARLPD